VEIEGVSQIPAGPKHDKEQQSARRPSAWNPAASQNAIPGRVRIFLSEKDIAPIGDSFQHLLRKER
jgi:hypothetical protein